MPIPTKQFPEQSLFQRFRPQVKRPIPSNRDNNLKPINIHLVNIDGANGIEKLAIQSIPLTLGVEPTANWAAIPVLGRNNPFYHYTGGEDTLAMTLDWYANIPDNSWSDKYRSEVIERCRWVESLSRSDGWDRRPPRVQLIWGNLFFNTLWIVTSAKYELSLFDRGNNMYPIQAYQQLLLKKVVDHNTTMSERRFKN